MKLPVADNPRAILRAFFATLARVRDARFPRPCQRADTQLKLQSTVEGLSVAAITYYFVGLISYLAAGAQELGWPLSAKATAALAVPVVAVGVWASIRRIHRRIVGH